MKLYTVVQIVRTSLLSLALLVSSGNIHALVTSVTTTADSGAGSLRQAILNVNASTDASNTITFAIPGTGPFVIPSDTTPGNGTNLPAIIKQVTINGYSQAGSSANTLSVGSNAVLQIVLSGVNIPLFTGAGVLNSIGLQFLCGASGSVVEGLVINNFATGILVNTACSVSILGNFLGTNATATSLQRNIISINALTSTNTIIGAAGNANRNVIAGSTLANGAIIDTSSTSTQIKNNLIGTDKSGTVAFGDMTTGIELINSTAAVVGATVPAQAASERNIISGASSFGITLLQSTNTRIASNYIGTNAQGTGALGNARGIMLFANNNQTTIGATGTANTALGNVISGNGEGIVTGESVYAQGTNIDAVRETETTSAGTIIANNLIGVDASGIVALGNTRNGIRIDGSNTVQVTANVISGNGENGIIIAEESFGNFIRGNFIGTDRTRTAALGNGNNGIQIAAQSSPASANQIGGIAAADPNFISNNGNAGIFIGYKSDNNNILLNTITANKKGVVIGQYCGDKSRGNTVSRNSIFNTGQGIDLADDGFTPNHKKNPVKGPNNFQNFPVLTKAANIGSNTEVTGALKSVPCSQFIIEFFSNPTSTAGVTQGKTFISSITVKTDKKGNASFDTLLPLQTAGSFISATATIFTLTTTGDTSEFSPDIMVV